MRSILARFFRPGVSRGGVDVCEMREQFGPERSFSVMVPSEWSLSTGDKFFTAAPDNGPALGGLVFRIDHCPPLAVFADARYQGVLNMGMYKQVGKERPLSLEGGVLREYQGRWPGDKFLTYYAVACKNEKSVYVSLSLTTTKDDYTVRRVFYERMLATLKVRP